MGISGIMGGKGAQAAGYALAVKKACTSGGAAQRSCEGVVVGGDQMRRSKFNIGV
jgi:hypothetical protein